MRKRRRYREIAVELRDRLRSTREELDQRDYQVAFLYDEATAARQSINELIALISMDEDETRASAPSLCLLFANTHTHKSTFSQTFQFFSCLPMHSSPSTPATALARSRTFETRAQELGILSTVERARRRAQQTQQVGLQNP